MDPRTARQADEAATNLLRRIQERHSQLQRSLSLQPEIPSFNQADFTSLTNWLATSEERCLLLSETNSVDRLLLQARVSANGGGVGKWEKPVLLMAGTYRFSAKVLADQPVFRGPTPPVALRIWRVPGAQMESSRPDAQTMELQSTFEVGLDMEGEYLLHCEAKAADFTVTYQFGKIELTRVP